MIIPVIFVFIKAAIRRHISFHANDGFYFFFLATLIKFNGAVHIAMVGKSQGFVAHAFSFFDQLFNLWQAVQKRIVAVNMQMHEIGHKFYLSSRASRSDEGSTQIKKDLFSFIGIDPSSAKASLGMTELTTTFEAHLASLLNIPNKGYKLISINDGAQIIQRVTKKNNKLKFSKIKNVAIVNAITYKNTNIGSDLIRIQCNQSIMQTPNSFNKLGKEIKAAIEKIC